MRISRTIIIAGILSIALAGCAGPVDTGESPIAGQTSIPTADPGTEPTVEPTETPVATPTATPSANSDAVLTTAGYGDLVLGKRVPSDTELVKWDAERCDDRVGYSGGRWIPADGVDDDDETYFVVRTVDGKKSGAITQIIVWDPSIQTKSGAHIGSTRDELKDLFPKLKKVRSEDPVSGLYAVSDSAGRVIFETEKHTVVDIIVQQTDVEPSGVQGTDVGGFCTG